MSGSNGDSNVHLDGLFASLRSNSSSSPHPNAPNPAQSPSMFGFDGTVPSRTPHQQQGMILKRCNTRFNSLTVSSAGTTGGANPVNAQANAQTNLLDLLKFAPATTPRATSQQAQTPEAPRSSHGASDTHSVHGRGISASDLVASLRSGGSKPATPIQSLPRSSSTSHQDSLLKLLNQTTASVEEKPFTAPSIKDQTMAKGTPSPARQSSPIRFFGSKENTPTPFQPEAIAKASPSAKSGPLFTYVNPFEQLSASSPLNAQPRISPNSDSSKRKVKSPSPAAVPSSSRRKLTPSGSEVLQSIETPEAEPLKDGRSQVEALMGIGAPSKDAETVTEALNEVGGHVHKRMEHALAEAEGKKPVIKQEKEEDTGIPSDTKASKSQPADNPSIASLAKASKDTDSPEKNADEWESAEGGDDTTKASEGRKIPTYQFPMLPFVLIEVSKDIPSLAIREDSIVNIARFKKDFDQTDRTLATATKDFIVYGMPKNGGIRVIQQDNGTSNLLFPTTQDRIFNVAVSCDHAGASSQGVIATGVSGAVYWTTIGDHGRDLLQADMEAQAVIIPPILNAAEPIQSGQLKTRAKKASRHPEFFAIGRGKSIQIIFPTHARNSDFFGDASTLDTEKYFADRSLKVTTGKAGKDFTFSEDDSTIATLDKAGKLRIWDIRDLTAIENSSASKLAPIEVKAPLLSFATAHSTEKSWPTSVLFVDKIRAYIKGAAQRYIIIGMKQNHTLQLWDLCLGKAVQELSFPHDNETDAICSVAYHPNSGIIAVGHPTRNSIYLIHLSSPKYNLPNMSQAKFVQRLASKDKSLPNAEATAIMSGLREYSLSNVGQLRSMDIAPSASEAAKNIEDEEDTQLFELYIMHSKGVTCLGFKKEDLGLSPDSKALHPIDAKQEKFIVVKDLREPSLPSSSDLNSINGDNLALVTPSKSSSKAAPREAERYDRASTPSNNTKSTEKAEKKKAKQNGGSETSIKATGVSNAPIPPSNAVQRAPSPLPHPVPNGPKDTPHPSTSKGPSRDAPEPNPVPASERSSRSLPNGEPISLGISADFLDKEMKKIEQGVSTVFSEQLARELDGLHKRLDSDKHVQNAAMGANQEAILRLVSKQLGDNVEKSLASIVTKSIKETVTPFISEVTTNTLDKTLPHVVGQQIQHLLPLSLKSALPEAINRTMQSPEMHRTVSDQVTKSVTGHVEREFINTLNGSIIPTFKNLTISNAQRITQDTEHRIRDQLQQAEAQRRNDGAKIDQLVNSVRVLSETVHQMAEAQSEFQKEILRLQEKSLQDGQALLRRDTPTPSESASMHATPEQQETEAIAAAMQKGNYEEATIMVRFCIPLYDAY